MKPITFARNEYGAPTFHLTDDSFGAIGSLLTSDVQNLPAWSLDLLAWAEDAAAGRLREQSWQGNSWYVRITPDGLHLEDLYSDWTASYSLGTAHDVTLRYWRFQTGGAPDEARAAVTDWEREAGREHPCRPHL